MFEVRFSAEATALIGKMFAESRLSRPGLTIHRQGPVADLTRARDGRAEWNVERPHPWKIRLTDFEMIADDAVDVVIIDGMRIWLALIPRPKEMGVEVSVRNGELHVDAIAT